MALLVRSCSTCRTVIRESQRALTAVRVRAGFTHKALVSTRQATPRTAAGKQVRVEFAPLLWTGSLSHVILAVRQLMFIRLTPSDQDRFVLDGSSPVQAGWRHRAGSAILSSRLADRASCGIDVPGGVRSPSSSFICPPPSRPEGPHPTCDTRPLARRADAAPLARNSLLLGSPFSKGRILVPPQSTVDPLRCLYPRALQSISIFSLLCPASSHLRRHNALDRLRSGSKMVRDRSAAVDCSTASRCAKEKPQWTRRTVLE